MDFFEWLKISVGVVLAIIVVLTIKVIGDVQFYRETAPELAHNPVEDGGEAVDLGELQRNWPTVGDRVDRSRLRNYMRDIENVEVKAPEAGTGPQPVQQKPLAVLLAEASADAGGRMTGVCTACHTFQEGGRNNVGPNLWGVVGRDIASVPGFTYSTAMQRQEGVWTYEKLDAFLERPATAVPGTSMAFAGVRRASERANIIMYLRRLSPDAPPLPDIPPPAEEATEAPADETSSDAVPEDEPVEDPAG